MTEEIFFKLKAKKYWPDGDVPRKRGHLQIGDPRFQLGKLYLLQLRQAEIFHYVVVTIQVLKMPPHMDDVWLFRDRHKHAYFPRFIEAYAELGPCKIPTRRKNSRWDNGGNSIKVL